MSTELEKRVTTLESEMADLKQQLGHSAARKDWRTTVGMSKDDPGFDEMIELGREIREQDQSGGS